MRIRYLPLVPALLLAACGTEADSEFKPTPCTNTARGTVCTWAGTGQAGFDEDGKALNRSQLNAPVDVAFDGANVAYVLDRDNHRVRRARADGTFETVVGTGSAGDGEPGGADTRGTGTDGKTVALYQPTGMAFLPTGKAVIASWHNHKLRRYDPATGLVRLSAGSVQCSTVRDCRYESALYPGRPDGLALEARFDFPSRVVVNQLGEVYVLDQRTQRIRKLPPNLSEVKTSAGTGATGYGDGEGFPANAVFHFDNATDPETSGGLAFDSSGALYVADSRNHIVRRIEFNIVNDGTQQVATARKIEVLAGKLENSEGKAGYSGDGGPALGAELNNPTDLAVGPDGILYIADTGNHVVRAVDLATRKISTVVGTGQAGFEGDNGPATSAKLSNPRGVAIDPKGDLYIADTGNHRIRRVRLSAP